MPKMRCVLYEIQEAIDDVSGPCFGVPVCSILEFQFIVSLHFSFSSLRDPKGLLLDWVTSVAYLMGCTARCVAGSDVIVREVAGNRDGDRQAPEPADTVDECRQLGGGRAGTGLEVTGCTASRGHSLGQSALQPSFDHQQQLLQLTATGLIHAYTRSSS